MAPKSRRTKAPVVLKGQEFPDGVALSQISRGPLSGWRESRPGRKQELIDNFLAGRFKQSLFGEVCLLRKTDEDDKFVVDDGMATLGAMWFLEDKWRENGGEDPSGNGGEDPNGAPWHANLVEVFKNGMPVQWLEYEDDALQIRKLWNIGKHDAENNKFDATSIAQKVEAAQEALRAAANDALRAKLEMQSVLGDGSASNVKRWLRAAVGLPELILKELKDMAWLPEGFVFDNVFFIGGGTASDRQLTEYFQSKALVLARNDREDNDDQTSFTIKVWTAEVCSRLKMVDLWRIHLYRKFGTVAAQSDAVKKLIDHLCTKAGLLKVQECISVSVPCHGNGTAESGIPECRVLYKELERCKAGGLPPPVVQPDVTSSGGQDPNAGGQDSNAVSSTADDAVRAQVATEESIRFSLLEEDAKTALPDGVTQREHELFLKAREYIDAVTIFGKEPEFKDASMNLLNAGRSVFMIDLATSRKTQISAAIDIVGTLATNCERTRVITVLFNRIDVLADVEKKLKLAFPKWYHILLSAQSGDSFKPAYQSGGKSTLIYLSIPPCDKLISFPTNIRYSAVLEPGEKLRVMCANPDCPYRSGVGLNTGGDKLDEIDPDHKEVDVMAIMNGLDEGCEEETKEESQAHGLVQQIAGLEALTPHDKALDRFLFPHAHPVSYYEILLRDLGKASECRAMFLLTSSMHPSPWLAARQHNMSVVVYAPRLNQHAQMHGHALAVSVRLTRLLREAQQDEQPPLTRSDLQIIEGPTVPADVQVVEAYDISRGNQWFEGLNRMFAGADLHRLIHSLLRKELDEHNFVLIEPRSTYGRGLSSTAFIPEGEHVCTATCLWFDNKAKLMEFLAAHPNEQDRVGCVRGILHEGKASTVYYVLVGCAAFINHFQGIRRTPNVKLVYNATKGFNDGALSFVVSTRNKQGMGASEVVSNYGLDFDLTKVFAKSDDYQDRFKGPLVKFVKQSSTLAVVDVEAPNGPEVAGASIGCGTDPNNSSGGADAKGGDPEGNT